MKKAILLLVSALACGATMQAKELGISEFTVSYPRNPMQEGDTLKCSVKVTNNGTDNASGYVGYYYVGGKSAFAISLGWSQSLAPGESRVVESKMAVSFGAFTGVVTAKLNDDDDNTNNELLVDKDGVEHNISIIRKYANELLLSGLTFDDNGDPYMLYEGHALKAISVLSNHGREAQSGKVNLYDGETVLSYYDYSVEPEASDSVKMDFKLAAGTYSLKDALPEDENLDNNEVSSTIVVFNPERYNESFENCTYNASIYRYDLPEGWSGTLLNYGSGGLHGKAALSAYSAGAWTATPKLNFSENDSICFWASSGRDGCNWEVYLSTDFENWTLVETVTPTYSGWPATTETFSIPVNSEKNSEFAGKKCYVKVVAGGAQYPSISIDCFQLPKPVTVENDFEVLSVAAASYFEAGNAGDINITVQNNGAVAASTNITLSVDSVVIATLPTGEIGAGETKVISYTYTPTEANPASPVTAKADADDADANNSASSNLLIYPAGGLTLPFQQIFNDYSKLTEVPYWTWGQGWTIWYNYGSDQLDGHSKCVTFQYAYEGSQLAVSPLLNLENQNITVSFWLARDNNQWHADKLDGIRAWVNSRPDTIGGTELEFVHRSYTQEPVVDAAGWYQYTYTLTEGNHPTKGFIVFEGIGAAGSYGYFDMDEVEVSGQNDKDLALEDVTPGMAAKLGGYKTATYPVTATIKNVGFEAITGATLSWMVNEVEQAKVSYTGTLQPGETAEVELGNATVETNDIPVISVNVENAEDKIETNNNKEVMWTVEEAEQVPFNCEFNEESDLIGWWQYNLDDNNSGWSVADGQLKADSFDGATGAGYDQNDWIVTPAIYIPGEDATLTYDVKAEDCVEHYEVLVAETWNDTIAFKSLLAETVEGTKDVTLSLTDYAHKTVYIAFRHTSSKDDTEAVSLNIDNVNVTGTATGIHELTANDAENIKVYDLMGRNVKAATKGVFILNGKKIVK